MRDIKLVEVRSELAAGTRGASMGIDALKVASLDKSSDFFTRFDPIHVEDANDYLWRGNQHPYANYIDGVYEVLQNVYTTVKSLRIARKFPIILAGDHSTAAGTIMGIKAAHPEKRLGVIWIDAHADLHTPFTTPSGNMHGMPLAMCLGLDNLDQKINEPLPGTVAYWEKIKAIGGGSPKILPEDIVFIGVRDTEEAENYLIRNHKIPSISISDLRIAGIPKTAEKALASLKDCEQIYISFDVDSLDTSLSKGTGTPVPDGLILEEAIRLNEALIRDKRVCAWEIVEVNPTLDTENAMAKNAFDVLESTARSLVSHF
ncbi:arginase [Cyclobacterium jeungdonense]|uniref:Arginase n=1 Tax=Cyclobacterium jeungdonense TaxID=708087 RepID=A0ABT8C6E7_9BACT|nr:arginase [Cyclobacterium jeungdonense]MDN3688374.1 arginase [Cyclobacterium jeungdonense]